MVFGQSVLPGSFPDIKTLQDAYIYLLGRVLIIRQEQADLREQGIDYNIIKLNELGQPIDWVNPNLDVANIEAWIAVNESTPTILEFPKIEERYYTVQICDEWGEVITNINQRNYPQHPYGKYAFVAPGSFAGIPDDAVRIELRSLKAKMLARVEIQGDIESAGKLQKQFRLSPMGKLGVASAPTIPEFDNRNLPGVELFDNSREILSSAPDISPIAAQIQSNVLDIMTLAADKTHRAAIDRLLRKIIIPEFQTYSVSGAGIRKNNWMGTMIIGNYGDEFAIRSAANYVGIWANSRDEVIYFVTTMDADGLPLNGTEDYVIEFPADELPGNVVNAYWSLSLVDVPGFRAVPNELNRYTFNSIAPPLSEKDGTMKIFLSAKTDPRIPDKNRLPSPEGKPFSLTFRTYVPKNIVKQGKWFPPAIRKIV